MVVPPAGTTTNSSVAAVAVPPIVIPDVAVLPTLVTPVMAGAAEGRGGQVSGHRLLDSWMTKSKDAEPSRWAQERQREAEKGSKALTIGGGGDVKGDGG